ncbi:MAG TPA: hypothetical protein VGI19_14155 [Candidatus Cybelea sp.]
MRLLHYRIFCLASVSAFAAGCSPTQSGGVLPGASASQAGAQSAIGPSKALPRDLLYVAGGIKSPGWVTIYPQSGSDQQKIGAITKGVDTPFGLAVDIGENLYVGNYANSTVTVYARGAKEPFETLTRAGHPVAVAVGDDGTVYVGNQGTLGKSPNGASLLVYKKGQTKPSKTIPFHSGYWPFGLALDSSGDLFVTVNHPGRNTQYQGQVYEFTAGSLNGNYLHLRGLQGELAGIATDKQNNLLVVDDHKNAYYVLVYPPGKALPSQKIKISSGQAPFGIAINPANTEIWVSTGWGATVEGISYPGGSVLDVVNHHRGWAIGVAVGPASDN